MDVVASLLVVFLVFLVTLWIRSRQRHFQFFKRLGIDGPEPNIFFGNLLEFGRKGPSEAQMEWTKKYGYTFGYFVGTIPVLNTVDLEFLRMVQIKEASKFINRSLFVKSAGVPIEEVQKSLIGVDGEKWKRTRSILTPTFSTGKLKQIAYLMNDCIDIFMSKLDAMNGKPIDVFENYHRLTLDNILRAAFGIETDVQTDPKNSLYKDSANIEDIKYTDPLILLLFSFPVLSGPLFYCGLFVEKIKRIFGKPSLQGLVDAVRLIIQQRKANPQAGKKDLLQLMLDARLGKPAADMMDLSTSYNLDAKEESKSSAVTVGVADKLSEDELIGNSLVFMDAGQDTTSSLLSFTTHILASHPEAQEKLRQELLDNLDAEEKPDYNSVAKLPYLDQVIKEALRLYSPTITFTMRVALEDFEFKGKHYPKGLIIQVPVYALHRIPEYWRNPHDFDPERFSPDRKSEIPGMAYQPFGDGPRNCIGSRFAMLFAKMTLANVLSKYQLEHASPATAPKDVRLDNKLFVLHPVPFKAKFVPVSKKN